MEWREARSGMRQLCEGCNRSGHGEVGKQGSPELLAQVMAGAVTPPTPGGDHDFCLDPMRCLVVGRGGEGAQILWENQINSLEACFEEDMG